MSRLRSNLMLVLTALIWGCAFVAQRISMDYIGPWTFTCIRSFIGGTTLLCVMPLLKKLGAMSSHQENEEEKKVLIRGGIACGVVLAAASMFQQIGILYTTVGKAGFITALYVIIVPLFAILLGQKVTRRIWFSVLLAIVGFYFLSLMGTFTLALGDGLELASAVLFAVHILVIDHFSPLVNGVKMSCLQFFVCGLITLVPMFVLEHPEWLKIVDAAVPILYAGVLSSGTAYTLQIIAQRDADPTVATLLLSLESVFSLLAGFVILHQHLLPRELFGCVLVFAGIILAQLPERKEV